MPGADAEGIYYIREEEDAAKLYEAMQKHKGVRGVASLIFSPSCCGSLSHAERIVSHMLIVY